MSVEFGGSINRFGLSDERSVRRVTIGQEPECRDLPAEIPAEVPVRPQAIRIKSKVFPAAATL